MLVLLKLTILCSLLVFKRNRSLNMKEVGNFFPGIFAKRRDLNMWFPTPLSEPRPRKVGYRGKQDYVGHDASKFDIRRGLATIEKLDLQFCGRGLLVAGP